MKYHLDNLHTELKNFSLEKHENLSIRRSLISYIAANPLPGERSVKIVSPFSGTFKNLEVSWYHLFRSSSYVTAFAVIALVLGGSVSLAAENALPGDKLYGFKTDINENILTYLAVTPESQAELQSQLATKRIKEAEELAVQGKLTIAARTTINKKLVEHTSTFSSEVKKIQDNQVVVAAASRLEATLIAHKDVIESLESGSSIDASTTPQDLGTTGTDTTTDTSTTADTIPAVASTGNDTVTNQIQVSINEVQSARIVAEDKVKVEGATDAKTSAESALEDAKNGLDMLGAHIEDVKSQVGEAVYTNAMNSLVAASASFRKGLIEMDSELYGDAFTSFQEVIKETTETRVSIDALTSLNLSSDHGGDASTTPSAKSVGAPTSSTDTSVKSPAKIQLKLRPNTDR